VPRVLQRAARVLLVAILTIGESVLPCVAQTPEKKETPGAGSEVSKEEFQIPADEKTAAEIDQLVPKLNAPAYTERQSATDRLKEIGAPAFPKLRSTYLATDELEIRLRVEEIIRSAYMDHHVYSGHPFMGVQLGAVDNRDPKIAVPPATPAVQIKKIFEDTAAKRAGLKEGDILTAQDGVPLRGTGNDLVTTFSQGIARRTPGSRLVVTVLRENGPEDVEVILGRLPADTAQAGRFVGLPEKVERAKERFDPWWEFHFRESKQKTPSSTGR